MPTPPRPQPTPSPLAVGDDVRLPTGDGRVIRIIGEKAVVELLDGRRATVPLDVL